VRWIASGWCAVRARTGRPSIVGRQAEPGAVATQLHSMQSSYLGRRDRSLCPTRATDHTLCRAAQTPEPSRGPQGHSGEVSSGNAEFGLAPTPQMEPKTEPARSPLATKWPAQNVWLCGGLRPAGPEEARDTSRNWNPRRNLSCPNDAWDLRVPAISPLSQAAHPNERPAFAGLSSVAGAGFEPATFGL
jgi:hypothetical protein